MNYSFIKKHVTRPSFALVFVVIVLVAGAIYSNIYQCSFVFDDKPQIEDKVIIRDLANYFSFEAFLKSRPIVDLTFALNYRFGQLTVFGYHLVNVLIHIINGFLVYFLASTIFKQLLSGSTQRFNESSKVKAERGKVRGQRSKVKWDLTRQSSIINHQSSIGLMSLFAALIFVAHPIQTQAVTYTVQRYASLAGMFYMGSVLFYLKARILAQSSKLKAQSSKGKVESKKNGGQRSEKPSAFSFQLSALYSLSIICGMLAFLSKQNTASLPAAIILVEYLFIDRTWQGWKKKILWFTPIFILFVIFVLYVSGIFSGGHEGRGLLEDVSDLMRETELVSRWRYLCTQFNVLVIYIRLLFLPIGQNLDYMYHFKMGFFDGYTSLAFLFLVGLVGLAIWNIKKRPVLSLGILWFFITLSVESSIIPIKDALFEHRLYLPMFGFAIVVSWLVFNCLSGKESLAIIISVVFVVSLGTATFLRNRTWRNPVTLWLDVVSKSPQNPTAYSNLGNAFARQGSFDEAVRCYAEAIRTTPDYAEAHYNLGSALAGQGRLDEAIHHYAEAVRIKPGYADAHYNLGIALARKGDLGRAIRHYTKALQIMPDYVKAQINLGVVLARKGDLDQAIVHLSKALQIDPESAKAHNNLGGALAGQGRLDEAIHHYAEAVRIKPGYADAHYNLGIALARKGDLGRAIRHLSEALQIMPGHAKAHYDLGNLLASQGDLDGAIRHLSEVVRLSPDDNIPACYNIACAYARQNKIEESVVWLKKAVDKGFKRWELLKTDKDLENIRSSSYYKKIIEGLRD
jgi:tetratricopeptide (TPR) repeat protein